MTGYRGAKPLPDQDVLRTMFDYEPLTGTLLWRVRPRSQFKTESGWKTANTRAGKHAGGIVLHSNGYYCRHIKIGNGNYTVARIVWKLVHGFDPHLVDHIDGNSLNNSIANLRDCKQYQNLANARAKSNSTSPYKGVTQVKRQGAPMWESKIMHQGKLHYLGVYPTPEEAAAAYCGATIVLNGEFARMDYSPSP